MTTTTHQREALKPCPFCGAPPAQRTDFDEPGDDNFGGSIIECTRCQASTAVHFDRKESLYSSWNDRERASELGDREWLINQIANDPELPVAAGWSEVKPPVSDKETRAEIMRLMREDFDPTPPNWEGRDWNDNAEDVADSIVSLFGAAALSAIRGNGGG